MRICIVGHFGGKKVLYNGQTIKTIMLYDTFKRYGVNDVDKLDTYYIKKNPVLFIFMFIKCLISDKKYVVLLAENGRHILFPVFYFMSKYMKKEIYHYGIGGELAREAEASSKVKKYISSFKSNWMESVELTENLQELGVRNAIYLPNFKRLKILSKDDLPSEYTEPYRFCMFSRVVKEKGIEDAVSAVRAINEEHGRQIALLDIFGPIDTAFEQTFHQLVGNETRYCGIVPPSESVGALKGYYMLLFPTRFRYEGIPGTIIDALSAGLPVIARRWQYCDEILQHRYTGYIYDFDKPDKLKDMMEYAISHVADVLDMCPNCLEQAEKYSEEYVIKYIKERMGIAG